MSETQEANLTKIDGTVLQATVPAFPGNPDVIVKTRDGAVFVANSPVIGYGTNALTYHEAAVYELPG